MINDVLHLIICASRGSAHNLCCNDKSDSLLSPRYQKSRSGITGLLGIAKLEITAGHLISVQAKH